MNILDILLGIVLIALGTWLTVIQAKKLFNGVADTLGGNVGLLMGGITLIVCGIIEICRQI